MKFTLEYILSFYPSLRCLLHAIHCILVKQCHSSFLYLLSLLPKSGCNYKHNWWTKIAARHYWMASNSSSVETEDMRKKMSAPYVHWLKHVHSSLLYVLCWNPAALFPWSLSRDIEQEPLLQYSLKGELNPADATNLWVSSCKIFILHCSCKQVVCMRSAMTGRNTIVLVE